MSRPIKWHVLPRLSNAIEQIANLKNNSTTNNLFCVKIISQKPPNSVCTEYICGKSENARVYTCEMTVKHSRLVLLDCTPGFAGRAIQ